MGDSHPSPYITIVVYSNESTSIIKLLKKYKIDAYIRDIILTRRMSVN
ncbi:MAG: hypothetical protein QMD06_02075 [Candidatus Altarchaeum sp.]|nr:hypothetical protein [Candidatus Altarchaeum sp.]